MTLLDILRERKADCLKEASDNSGWQQTLWQARAVENEQLLQTLIKFREKVKQVKEGAFTVRRETVKEMERQKDNADFIQSNSLVVQQMLGEEEMADKILALIGTEESPICDKCGKPKSEHIQEPDAALNVHLRCPLVENDPQ